MYCREKCTAERSRNIGFVVWRGGRARLTANRHRRNISRSARRPRWTAGQIRCAHLRLIRRSCNVVGDQAAGTYRSRLTTDAGGGGGADRTKTQVAAHAAVDGVQDANLPVRQQTVRTGGRRGSDCRTAQEKSTDICAGDAIVVRRTRVADIRLASHGRIRT